MNEFLAMLGARAAQSARADPQRGARPAAARTSTADAVAQRAREIARPPDRAHRAHRRRPARHLPHHRGGKIELRRSRRPGRESCARRRGGAAAHSTTRQHQLTVDAARRAALRRGRPAPPRRRSLTNMLNNAAQATRDRGRPHRGQREREGAERRRPRARHGIGIEPGMLRTIFDMFVQAERALDRSAGGLGIGLTLARSSSSCTAARSRRGARDRARAASSSCACRASPARWTPAPRRAAESGAQERCPRVLVVDDNGRRGCPRRCCSSSMGHEARVAHDGLSAARGPRHSGPTSSCSTSACPASTATRWRGGCGPRRRRRLAG